MSHDYLEFSDTLSGDEYGLIVDQFGNIKGIWVPKHLEGQDALPLTISELCKEYFGIDPNDKSTQHTIH